MLQVQRPHARQRGTPNRVRQLRDERGLSQQELARILNTTAGTLSSIERARYAPTLAIREKLARLFGVPDAEIFPPTPPPDVTPPTDATT